MRSWEIRCVNEKGLVPGVGYRSWTIRHRPVIPHLAIPMWHGKAPTHQPEQSIYPGFLSPRAAGIAGLEPVSP